MKRHLIVIALVTINCHGMDNFFNKKKPTDPKDKRRSLVPFKSSPAIPIPKPKKTNQEKKETEDLYEGILQEAENRYVEKYSNSAPSLLNNNSLSETLPENQSKTHQRKKSNSFDSDLGKEEPNNSNTPTNFKTRVNRSRSTTNLPKKQKSLLDTLRLTKEQKLFQSQIEELEENKKTLTDQYQKEISEIQEKLNKLNQRLLAIGFLKDAKKKATIKFESQTALEENNNNLEKNNNNVDG